MLFLTLSKKQTFDHFVKRKYHELTTRQTTTIDKRNQATPSCRRGHSRPSQSLPSTRKILPVLSAWQRRVLGGDFLHLTFCLASYLPSYNPSQPHTCSLLVSHSTFFTLSPPHTPSLTRYLSADLLSPSHGAFALCLFFFFVFFSPQAPRCNLLVRERGEKMKRAQ